MAATFRTRPWQLAPLVRPGYTPAIRHNHTRSPSPYAAHQTPGNTRPDQTAAPKFSSIYQANGEAAELSGSHNVVDGFHEDRADCLGSNGSRRFWPLVCLFAPIRVNGFCGQKWLRRDMTSLSTAPANSYYSTGTLIPIPFTKSSQMNLKSTLYYYKEIFMQRMVDRAGIFSQTWRLKRGRFWTRATFRAERKGIVKTALELHADMSRCLASGAKKDLERLGTICVPKLRRSLVAAVKSRPPGKSYRWEMVKMYGRLPRVSWLPRFFSWPRLVDHKWSDIDVGYTQSFRQAVVGIKSRQRLTELDARGKEVGSKEMELMEYVVLWRSVDKANLTQGDWFIYGTVKETSLKELNREKTDMQTMSDLMSEQKIREARKETGVA